MTSVRNKSLLDFKGKALFQKVDFKKVEKKCHEFAKFLENNFEELKRILSKYETLEVVYDETERTLDLLKNIHENKKFFKTRIGPVAVFLPKNQPLYSLVCFAIIPSFQATEVHFRAPHAMRNFYNEFVSLLKIKKNFPNIFLSNLQRADFLEERSAILVNQDTKESCTLTDALIFTGNKENADVVRSFFSEETLFIYNGYGHNPVVISSNADLELAVRSVLSVQLYNQGQDCASPNAILVHHDVYSVFMRLLKEKLHKVKIGDYNDSSTQIGPISEYEDLVRIQGIFTDNFEWLDKEFGGFIDTAKSLVHPAIISKPLKLGGNYIESFAPIFYVQKYDSDQELSVYFENEKYLRNAMYISLFGTSEYIDLLSKKKFDNRLIHSSNTIIRNSDPHAKGFERGTQPYGGYGIAASGISYKGKNIFEPTLPQRDIYENLSENTEIPDVKILKKKIWVKQSKNLRGLKANVLKNLEELENKKKPKHYYSLVSCDTCKTRKIEKISSHNLFNFLNEKNLTYVLKMNKTSVQNIHRLRSFLGKAKTAEEINEKIYEIPKLQKTTKEEIKTSQKAFFRDIYNLLIGDDFGPRLNQLLLVEPAHIAYLLDI